MSTAIEDQLAQSRANATNEERIVLALEAIADQLKLLMTLLPIAKLKFSDEGGETAARKDSDFRAEGAWENEGGSLGGSGPLAALGIKHSVIDEFTVGKYHYTNLPDALAQAKRSRSRPDC